jgi:hypothetical protein
MNPTFPFDSFFETGDHLATTLKIAASPTKAAELRKPA